MTFSDLEKISGGRILQLFRDSEIKYLVMDSRKALIAPESLFFAINGERHDGHHYIPSLYVAGIRQFVLEKEIDIAPFPEANFLIATSSLAVLQAIVTNYRNQFVLPVIGITGSNGKTIIKEWLHQLLAPDYNIVKNPGSYNSQIGVPLSVWAMQAHHQLGLFEAGISQPGEMEKLARIIKPSIGLFTNIGSAHNEGFENLAEKIKEKIKLFATAETIVYCKDQLEVSALIETTYRDRKLLSWGSDPLATVQIHRQNGVSKIGWKSREYTFTIPFRDNASVENLHHCIVLLLYLDVSPEQIQERIAQLKGVSMRMELKQGINHCQLIDDTYNNDLGGLQISLDFLAGQQKKNKTVILSDVYQSGLSMDELISRIETLVIKSEVTRLILIGNGFASHSRKWNGFKGRISFYNTTESFLANVNRDDFHDQIILIKGARPFRFERIVNFLQKKKHGTVMEIDLGAMVHNLNYFKSKLKPGTKLMAMVKAFAYGSGSEEVANLLQYHRVDYLGVAYTDEGVELRKNQITLPIMVMNPSEESFTTLMEYQLEPEIYNLQILRVLIDYLRGREIKIHFKIETGMHRLGFDEKDLEEAIHLLRANNNIHIATLFSHLAGADDEQHDDFTRQQARVFDKLSLKVMHELNIRPWRHLVNTSGIIRFPDLQFDMVRLGIGLYGVNPTSENESSLQSVATLKSVISQVKTVPAGTSIGYGRKGKAEKNTTIATIAIGYADGYSRAFSHGKGIVSINGKRAPVIGNVCMDMTMIDITNIDAKEGDEVILFGKEPSIYEVAERANTIPYEILTNTSERVKRVFWSEGI
ncbi:MAG: bifunctional UDP-N-acetylmuramoyl-tripeptide:D-alanyl-D-alanine ligase/alanine racemase [Azospira oryzae]|nr:MAG: bifunctional UDP-N-acetylmuramoyl-tripeptide:D-alanyl-D-alanine ligase/alanine racemase [Azospira oryzae]